MHRLFVALRPPLAMRARLLALMGGVPGARWQDDAQLHLTLRFIGEVDRHQADDIAAALASVSQPRPTIALAGVGTFDHKGKIDALWAGIAPDRALAALRERITRALVAVGIAPEERAFKPHITLARLNRASAPIDGFLADAAGLSSPAVTLDAFLLYESMLGGHGAVYNAVARYPLN